MKILTAKSMKHHLLIFVLLVFTMAPNDINAQPRTIALVFDDSGSMNAANGEPCRAVNYALQLMTGLLNPEDKFYVVKMSQPQTLMEINLETKQQEIQTISQWTCKGNTYFQAADTAMGALEAAVDKNTDKWLIIFTDGKWEINPAAVERIKKFVAGSGAKTIILNINTLENPLCSVYKEIGLADIYQSPAKFESIRKNMELIALSVMSMTQSGLKTEPLDQTIKINTVFPLKRLIILEQDTTRTGKLLTVDRVLDNNGQQIIVEGNYDALISRRIQGRVTHVIQSVNTSQVIPEGEIRIKFNKQANISRFKFLPEVAARLTAAPKGEFVNAKGNVYSICETQNEIQVEAEIKSLDGSRLKPEVLKNAEVIIHYQDQKERMPLTGNVFTKTIPVRKKMLPVSVSAEYPGYFNFRTNVFVIEKVYCKPPDQLGMKDVRYPPVKVTELDKAAFLDLIPLINEKKVTKEQFKELYLSRNDTAGIDIEIREAETYWKIRPRAKWGIPCLTGSGTYKVIFELKSTKENIIPETGPTTVVIEILPVSFIKRCAPFIFGLLIVVFLLWYILGIIKKPRFCRGSEIIYQRSTQFVKNREISDPLPGSFFTRYFIPYLPETAKIQGIKFKAGKRCAYIELPKDAQAEDMYISGNLIEDPGRRDARISNGDELLVKYRNYKETYKYQKI